MTALGVARRFRKLLGLLQLGIGALVGLDLVHQQIGLPAALLLGDATAVLGEHEQPGGDAGDDGENEKHRPQRRFQDRLGRVGIERNLKVDKRQHRADHAAEEEEHPEISADIGIERRRDPVGQDLVDHAEHLGRDARLRLAAIAAARFERAAQRADRPGICRAVRHVLGLERMLADRAPDQGMSAPILPRRAGDVETALRDISDRRRHDEGDREREKCRQRLQRGPEHAEERHDAGHRRGQHRSDAHRIDVVEMGALEFDPGRAEAERLVDGEVRHQRADPGDRHDGVKPKDVLQHLEDAELHQHAARS